MIDLMPPGLYEAVITGIDETVENPELVQGSYLFTLERRKLDDIPHSAATAQRTTSLLQLSPGFPRSRKASTAR